MHIREGLTEAPKESSESAPRHDQKLGSVVCLRTSEACGNRLNESPSLVDKEVAIVSLLRLVFIALAFLSFCWRIMSKARPADRRSTTQLEGVSFDERCRTSHLEGGSGLTASFYC